MPTLAVAAPQEEIDAVPVGFGANFKGLEELYSRFVEILRTVTLETLQQRTSAACGDATRVMYPLGYHQAIHLALHCGQIRTIRNLYRKVRGEPARFFRTTPRIRPSRGPWSMASTGSANRSGWVMQFGGD